MYEQDDGIKSILDVIEYTKDLYALYYSEKNQKMGLRFYIKGFSEDDGKRYDIAMNEIAQIISKMKVINAEYQKKISVGANLVFSKELEKKAQAEFFERIFIEFSKLKDINLIEYVQEDIEKQIRSIKEIWKIDDIIVSTWKDFLGKDDCEAYRRLIQENEELKRKIEQLTSQKKIAEKLGYLPAYTLPNNNLLLHKSNND